MLLEGRIAAGSGVAGGAGLVVVDDAVLAGAERALASDTDSNGRGEDSVGGDEAGGIGCARSVGDEVTALSAGGEDRVDGGNAGAAAVAGAEVRESRGKTLRRTLHKILNISAGKGADGADRGRFICGDAGLEQVGNGDAVRPKESG